MVCLMLRIICELVKLSLRSINELHAHNKSTWNANFDAEEKGLQIKSSNLRTSKWKLNMVFSLSMESLIRLLVRWNCRWCFFTPHDTFCMFNWIFLINFFTDKARSIFMDSGAVELGRLKWTKYVNGLFTQAQHQFHNKLFNPNTILFSIQQVQQVKDE